VRLGLASVSDSATKFEPSATDCDSTSDLISASCTDNEGFFVGRKSRVVWICLLFAALGRYDNRGSDGDLAKKG